MCAEYLLDAGHQRRDRVLSGPLDRESASISLFCHQVDDEHDIISPLISRLMIRLHPDAVAILFGRNKKRFVINKKDNHTISDRAEEVLKFYIDGDVAISHTCM